MEDGFKQIECNDADIVGFDNNIYKIGIFRTAVATSSGSSLAYKLHQHLIQEGVNIKLDDYVKWFGEGIDCEILQLGSTNWQKGKVKIKLSVEFYAEEDLSINNSENIKITESESPLDDLRRLINKSSQNSPQ